ncbi:MAG: alpha/beta hydrolase [Verrucomicrobiota bacterium]
MKRVWAWGTLFLLLTFSMNAEAPFHSSPVSPGDTLFLWDENKVPGTVTPLPEEIKKTDVERISNVSKPQLTLYRASSTSAVPAIIICPGGGYGILAYDKEGTEIAGWLNSIGITALVLKYRVPNNREGALMDLQRAMQITHAHAQEWGIEKMPVGVLGFSAGGHLCARLSSQIDSPESHPDFAILIYPAYLEDKEKGTLASELAVTSQTPPTLIIHTEDDAAFVQGSKVYAAALKKAEVPSEFLLYPTGGHGYGLRSSQSVKTWPQDCEKWLIERKIK